MSVLNEKAEGFANIASVVPHSNATLLAEGHGIAVEPGNSTAIGDALVRLCRDLALLSQMGQLAREYVATHHNAEMLARSLLRASFFAPPLRVERQHP